MIETLHELGAPGLDFETGESTKLNTTTANTESVSIRVLRTVAELRAWSRDARRPVNLPDDAGCGTVSWAGPPGTVGLVPTMGALHEGHASLIRAAAASCGAVAVSIFVNPTQFGPNEDFARYPRTFDADCALAQAAGADVIFAPHVEEIYPAGAATFIDVEGLSDRLDGKSRPGHFRGVATVVAKLFIAAEPDQAFFGQKDAAQVAVLRRMTADLRLATEIVVCPIVREADGLALSSRNIYLSEEERECALTLSRAVLQAEALYACGERRAVRILHAVRMTFAEMPQIRVDYVALVDWETLEPVEIAKPGSLFAVAAWVGATRLIDNATLGLAVSPGDPL
jgi:pantoate--beta-alanine ligase